MKTHDHRDSEYNLVSFEIMNIGRSRVCRFVSRTFPATSVRKRQEVDFGHFEMNGRAFVVTEPWGDNSRYLIHQEPPQASPELEALRTAFEKYRPSWVFSGDRVFGIVLGVLIALLAGIMVAVVLLSK